METLIETMRRIAGGKAPESFVATVEKVNGRTCDVQPVDGAALKSVRLNANISDGVGLLVTPVEGSAVLVTRLSEVDSFVSLFSAIEKVEVFIGEASLLAQEDKVEMVMGGTTITVQDSEVAMTIGGAEVKVSGDKFVIKNGAYTLKQAFNELIAEINAAIITTPAGPGNIAPVTVTKLTAIDNKVNELLA